VLRPRREVEAARFGRNAWLGRSIALRAVARRAADESNEDIVLDV